MSEQSKKQMTYADAGVDIDAGNRAVELMKESVRATYRPEVIGDLGGFGGLFALNSGKYQEPILVSGTDGVGTKLKLAFMADKHNTIGQDAVAMCVNDILVQGAEPLFFLDYIAVDKVDAEKVANIVQGVAKACQESGCALIGGETAEMAGFYSQGEYDIAGFCVGVVEKSKMITGDKVAPGDVLLGLPSSGVHSNGFSLVRKICFEVMNYDMSTEIPEFGPSSLSFILLWSCAAIMETIVSPSVNASKDASSPSINSSKTTRAPAPPNLRSPIISSTAANASASVIATTTPLPAAKPSALTTIGAPFSLI